MLVTDELVFSDGCLKAGRWDSLCSEPVCWVTTLKDWVREGGGTYSEALFRMTEFPVTKDHLMVMKVLADPGRINLLKDIMLGELVL